MVVCFRYGVYLYIYIYSSLVDRCLFAAVSFRHDMCSSMFDIWYMEYRVWRIVYVIMCLIYGICSAVFLYVI